MGQLAILFPLFFTHADYRAPLVDNPPVILAAMSCLCMKLNLVPSASSSSFGPIPTDSWLPQYHQALDKLAKQYWDETKDMNLPPQRIQKGGGGFW
jgi:hypothetical protein